MWKQVIGYLEDHPEAIMDVLPTPTIDYEEENALRLN